MRLAEFILQEMEAILVEWEAFAATLLPAAAGMSSLALRDHARPILEAVAKDIASSQTREARAEKSKGRAPKVPSAPETAAQTHAVLRARGGFDINQLVAEYRALRASVLRLWTDAGPLDRTGVEDVIRFNEAIDQAIAESVGHFHAQVERARNLLLGMLGRDMWNLLQSILHTAARLQELNAGEQVSAAAARLIRSGASMQALLDDLVNFNRTNLGPGMKVVPAGVDVAAVAADELEQFRGAHPDRRIELAATGDLRGRWDGLRLHQLLRNLVSNAIKYGSPDTPVRGGRAGRGGRCLPRSHEQRAGHRPDGLRPDLRPAQAGAAVGDNHDVRSGLGLGLFIVREIARAHGGDVEVSFDRGETTFAARLPRHDRRASP